MMEKNKKKCKSCISELISQCFPFLTDHLGEFVVLEQSIMAKRSGVRFSQR